MIAMLLLLLCVFLHTFFLVVQMPIRLVLFILEALVLLFILEPFVPYRGHSLL